MGQYGKICCTESCVPKMAVSNHQLSTMMDTSDEWISSRTGIESRNIVVEENTSDLCTAVAKQLLLKSGKTAEELDFIIVATMTPDYSCPSVACIVQGNISASNAFAFDISAACTGFVYALSVAEKLIRTGKQLGMVIGGETLSKVLDWQDRSTAVLFGDGAAGVLIEKSNQNHFLKEKLQSDGKRSDALTSGYIANKSPFIEKQKVDHPYLQMSGRAIYDFSLKDVINNISELTEGIEVDYLLLHQANKRIIDKVAKKLSISREKFLTNMEVNGNTSAASIPLLLAESVENGTLVLGSNQKIVLTGYGGGLTWGSMLITL